MHMKAPSQLVHAQACCDAIVFAKEGERLLAGVTAEQLYRDPTLQQACEEKLARAIAEGVTFEFEIVTYLTTSRPSHELACTSTTRNSSTGDRRRTEAESGGGA